MNISPLDSLVINCYKIRGLLCNYVKADTVYLFLKVIHIKQTSPTISFSY